MGRKGFPADRRRQHRAGLSFRINKIGQIPEDRFMADLGSKVRARGGPPWERLQWMDRQAWRLLSERTVSRRQNGESSKQDYGPLPTAHSLLRTPYWGGNMEPEQRPIRNK